MNQNVLSVIKTICLLYAFLLGKPVVLGTLGLLQGTASLMSAFHPGLENTGAGLGCSVQLSACISRKWQSCGCRNSAQGKPGPWDSWNHLQILWKKPLPGKMMTFSAGMRLSQETNPFQLWFGGGGFRGRAENLILLRTLLQLHFWGPPERHTHTGKIHTPPRHPILCL